jgi:hypothetical protein
MVSEDIFGQIFITDTNRAHLDHIMSRSANAHSSWLVDTGNFSLISE